MSLGWKSEAVMDAESGDDDKDGFFVLQGQEYAESYKLQYKRDESDGWTHFRDRRRSEVRSDENY